MHGCIAKWLARTLATVVVLGVPAIGLGQDAQPEHGTEAGYLGVGADQAVPTNQFVSSSSADGDLAGRVAKLEAALKKAEAKAEADKKKAAGKPSVNVGGRIQMDMAGFQQNAASVTQTGGNINNGAEFRRARIAISGDAFDVVEYKAEFDFANATNAAPLTPTTGSYTEQVAFKDVYIGIKELPLVGNFRAGHFKEPFGLDQLTSSRSILFMERSLGDEGALVPGRNMGMMFTNTYDEEHGTWAAGWFVAREGETPPLWQNDNGGTAMTMRCTYLPWYDEATDGRGLWHLGAAYSYRDVTAGRIVASARPEAHLAPAVIGGNFDINAVDQQLFGAETAMVYGSFSAQAEYYGSWADRSGADADVNFNGMYVAFSYFLTGEHRPYNRKTGAFDRVKPNENFFRVRAEDGCCYTGKGAWELAYRYSYLDLMDGLTTYNGAGRCGDHTIGVNWYLNPYTRIMANYIYSDVDRVVNQALVTGGYIQTAMMRFAIDF